MCEIKWLLRFVSSLNYIDNLESQEKMEGIVKEMGKIKFPHQYLTLQIAGHIFLHLTEPQISP